MDDLLAERQTAGTRGTHAGDSSVLIAGSQKAINSGVWGRAPGPAEGGLLFDAPYLKEP